MRVLITYPDIFLGRFIKQHLLQYNYEIIDINNVSFENYSQIEEIFKKNLPHYVILHIPFSGGIKANIEKPAELFTKNLIIQTYLIYLGYKYNIKKLIFIGSSCMYPRNYVEPLKEEYLLTAPLEETNEAYAIAKIAGWQMCKAYNKQYKTSFITIIPANIYGPFDDFDPETAHVIGALIYKFHKAKENKEKIVSIWGTGKPIRDFIYVEDVAEAIIFCLKNDIPYNVINIGSGIGYSIKKIAYEIKEIVNFKGDVIFDKTKPDGMPVKVLDTSRISKLGWKPKTPLKDGLKKTYNYFLNFFDKIC
ncbi:MAG TPA: NAD-dependent epimerase/dehydratase family protein [Candidatus Desulfofervidus auxilii]|uniref:GDP-L-fucose synthase n=1 Tax=Desulfofervidus auxilii TaxID=1621989 RepID=A0A7C0U3R0_DESA2|nr:NAD-dependent epimerase/dehydratase family protein [Candidatus Desulfofervidus auxilii]